MTTENKNNVVGREGLMRCENIEISVIIRDVRLHSFILDYLVEPTAGSGMIWVESQKVQIV